MDATYKTNVFNMPFFQIVGVSSTNKTFCIASAFISEEKVDNYKWVLEQLKVTLNECMLPCVIVTDMELALMKACEVVFPHANHLLCRWHINQNIFKHHKKYFKTSDEWDFFVSMWKVLIDSPTWVSYSENYERLQTFLSPYPGVLKYLRDTWLDKYKNHFVSASIDRSLNFGNRTSNRVESQHAKFKKCMRNTRSTLDKLVRCIDKIVKLQLTVIRSSFGRSEIYRYHHHNIRCFHLLRGLISAEALNFMVKEIRRLNYIQLNSLPCGCQLYNSCGLPCACRLSLYMTSGECIPLHSIDMFWRTLDLSATTSLQSDDICCDTQLNNIKEHFNKESNAGKRSVLRKLGDILSPSKTTIKPPKVKQNTRGRPSLRKQEQQRKRGSCKFFNIDMNMQPKIHSSNSQRGQTRNYIPDLNKEPPKVPDLNEEPPKVPDLNLEPNMGQPSHSYDLIRIIPPTLQSHVTSMYNMIGDGNCGFRSVAYVIDRDENRWPVIRQNLLQELDDHELLYTAMWHDGFQNIRHTVDFFRWGIAPPDKWMNMPDTGLVIASFNNQPVIFISPQQSNTCFPLRDGPGWSKPTSPIGIARIWGDHFINVTLDESFPVPPLHPQWRRYRSVEASAWEDVYSGRNWMYH